MNTTTITTFATRANVAGAIVSLLALIGASASQAAPINPIPGAVTCVIAEFEGVGGRIEGFLDPETNMPEVDLGSFDGVECGPSDPAAGDPPRPVPPDPTTWPYPGERDLHLHGMYELHGMYGFFNNGIYGVYNLHGIYNVQGILHDGNYYNFDRFGDAAPPRLVPEPAAAWLLGSGLLALLGVARRKR